MSTIILDRTTLQTSFPNAPALPSATFQRSAAGRGELRVTLAVNDSALRGTPGMDGFDGLESPFVWLHTKAGDWQRFALNYDAHVYANGYNVDQYSLTLNESQFNAADALLRGIAIGLDTKKGQVWLQQADDNWPVNV